MRWKRRLVAIALVLAIAWPLPAAGQNGADDPSQRDGTSVAALIPDPRVTPGLLALPVDSAAYRSAVSAWQRTLADIADARRTIARNETTLVDLDAERANLRRELDEQRVLLADAVYEHDGLRRAVGQLAVDRYVRGGPAIDALALIDAPDVTGEIYQRGLVEAATSVEMARAGALRTRVDELRRGVAARAARLVAIGVEQVDARATIDDATRRVAQLTATIPAREQAVRDRRLGAVVVGTDITLVVLDAYVKAAARLRAERAACGLEWWMVAALGRIESQHGTYGGAEVLPSGQTSVRIIGIALDGDDNTQRITDTDRGVLDGDPVLDRAVGPMQFIPATWRTAGRDGNGDGVRDPHNYYDAALAAAGYLCGRSPTLATTEGLRRAYFAYNRSSSYVDTAVENGRVYQRLTIPRG